jgi:hypothetical protein
MKQIIISCLIIGACFKSALALAQPSGNELAMGLKNDGITSKAPNSPVQSDTLKHWWVKASGGYDYSFLTDLINGTKGWEALFATAGPGVTYSFSTGNSGIAAGLELGYRLDKTNSFVLNVENIWTQKESWNYTAGTYNDTRSAEPSLLSATLNYRLNVPDFPGGAAFLAVGGGYYRATVKYSYVETSFPSGSSIFSGDTLGGVIGLGQSLDIGSGFGIDVSFRGRWATIDKVTAQAVFDSNTGETLTDHAPYTLGMSPWGEGVEILEPMTAELIGHETFAGPIRYAVVDYSGFTGEISFYFNF